MFARAKKFIVDVRGEFKKVTWPTREQTIKQTGAVLVISGITAIFLGAVDVGLNNVVQLIIG